MAGRTGRRADDEAVGVEGDDFSLVNRDVHFDEACKSSLVNHRIVERQKGFDFFAVAVNSDAQNGAFIDDVTIMENFGQIVFDILGFGFGEYAKIAKIKAHDQRSFFAYAAGGFEQRAVSAQHKHEVAFLHEFAFFEASVIMEGVLKVGIFLENRGGVGVEKNFFVVFFENLDDLFDIGNVLFIVPFGDDADSRDLFFDWRDEGHGEN